MTGKAPGGTSRKFGGGGGFGRKFPEGGLDFLEVALVWKFPDGILPKQTSKKFASEPPKLLRSPSRSGSMGKLILALSYIHPCKSICISRYRLLRWHIMAERQQNL